MKYLLNTLIFLLLFIVLIKSQSPSLERKRNSENSGGEEKKPNKLVQNDPYKVIYYLINSRVLYECNKRVFDKHQNVMIYYKFLHSKRKLKRMKISEPKGVLKINLEDFKNKFKIAEFSYSNIIRNNPFSQKIWPSIWRDCDFNCFGRNNFKILKIGLVNEINEYRRIHGVPKLRVSSKLNKWALKEAIRNSKAHKTGNCGFSIFGCVRGAGPAHFGNLIVKVLYDRFLSDYTWCNHYRGPLVQTQFLWKKTTDIGIGIKSDKGLIYVVFLFLPKGNIMGKYNNNVLPISEKVIYMYNYYANRQE